MAKGKKPPTAGRMADSTKPELAKISVAQANATNLRNLVAYFSQDGWKANPHAQEGAKAAIKAFECFDAGNAQETLYNVLVAMSAMNRLQGDFIKMLSESSAAEWSALWPYVHKEVRRKLGKQKQQAKTLAKAHSAIDESLKMINDGSSKTDAQRRAAKKHETSLNTVRKHWPKYLG